MADQEHVDILKQRSESWNAWRKKNPEITPDFTEAQVVGAFLQEADLSGGDFSEANLTGSILIKADLRKSDFWRASLQNAFLVEANLTQAKLQVTDLGDAKLEKAILVEAELMEANLQQANLWNASLRNTNLWNANFRSANLERADLRETTLQDADLSKADLSGADLSRADLSGASLRGANLSAVSFRRADLRGADLRGATLRETDMTEAVVGLTIFGDLDLRSVKGLETVRHVAPSTIGTDTLIRSRAMIPDIFLREAGIPESFLASVCILAENPLDAATYFLSYAKQDQAVAERLFADLGKNGVRCWQAPEGFYIGEKFKDHLRVPSGWGEPPEDELREGIDEPVRNYDALLLVLSEQTLVSPWLPLEVKMALRYEQEQGKQLLFPIMLDEVSMRKPEIGTAEIWHITSGLGSARWVSPSNLSWDTEPLLVS